MSGLRFVFDPYAKKHRDSFVPIEHSCPTVALDIPNCPVVGIIVSETIYVMHKGVAEHCALLEKKMAHNDTFEMKLWNRQILAMAVTPPKPALFSLFFLKMYGIHIQFDGPNQRRDFDKLLQYMNVSLN